MVISDDELPDLVELLTLPGGRRFDAGFHALITGFRPKLNDHGEWLVTDEKNLESEPVPWYSANSLWREPLLAKYRASIERDEHILSLKVYGETFTGDKTNDANLAFCRAILKYEKYRRGEGAK